MTPSLKTGVSLAAVACAGALLWWSAGQARARQDNRATASTDKVERGRYLVHHVAKCVECHTPRTDDGELIERRLLMGAPIPVRSPYEGWDWADASARIAGLGAYSERDVVRVLTDYVGSDGEPPRPPMPNFGMKRADAEAIAAYLATVTAPR